VLEGTNKKKEIGSTESFVIVFLDLIFGKLANHLGAWQVMNGLLSAGATKVKH